MAQVSWTHLAVEDLKSIYAHISNDSENYAWRLIEKISDRVGQMKLFRLAEELFPNLRMKQSVN